VLTRRRVLHQFGLTGASLLALRAFGGIAAAKAARTEVDFDIPRGACDCHVHVFDPTRFPYAKDRVYTPPEALIDELLGLQRALHLDRIVVVQPSVYGTDNSCTLDAIRHLGPRARGVAVLGKVTSRAELDDMAAAGVRGVRLNMETTTSGELDASAVRAILDRVAEQIRGLGWHVQIYTHPSIIAALKDYLAQLPVAVVFDHFGGAKAALGPSQPGFDALLGLVKSGRAYVKISGSYRISTKRPDFADVASLAQAVVAANSDRIVWGTDWPHTNSRFGRAHGLAELAPPFPIDDGLLLNQLPKWVTDPTIRKKILVDNPARLYGFSPL
jgi:predicted TIM-barrel fold metal-dependent hydrolase